MERICLLALTQNVKYICIYVQICVNYMIDQAEDSFFCLAAGLRILLKQVLASREVFHCRNNEITHYLLTSIIILYISVIHDYICRIKTNDYDIRAMLMHISHETGSLELCHWLREQPLASGVPFFTIQLNEK